MTLALILAAAATVTPGVADSGWISGNTLTTILSILCGAGGIVGGKMWGDRSAKKHEDEIRAQIQAVYDAGYEEWLLWSAACNYHWEALKAANGGKVLMCPICGLKECSEMDHYVPRSLFHEFSSHISNLIPLCHDCNQGKHDFWLNDEGQRCFFNAFFDTYSL